MANGHGGARPGSGRKKKTTVEEQLSRRDVLFSVFTPEEWHEVAVIILAQVKGGNIGALLPYLPYLLGSPRQELNVSGEIKHALTIADIRKAIGAPTP